jgi:hypothetical protein
MIDLYIIHSSWAAITVGVKGTWWGGAAVDALEAWSLVGLEFREELITGCPLVHLTCMGW